ncbi:hypothetical protein V5P93_001601 [Actinokineospora auranticolor]|uniref:Uncharacterized protein n=1 Tax=Actinokineospora auranticolor TaxID=155976 RepID=A0A2S6GBN6_9PSEU|nr:hypothetical protein [Actinokineospora auranticolor]PPK61086.1 hypothetical protein CLV40_1448 [Actinokineospora auranticolor]
MLTGLAAGLSAVAFNLVDEPSRLLMWVFVIVVAGFVRFANGSDKWVREMVRTGSWRGLPAKPARIRDTPAVAVETDGHTT